MRTRISHERLVALISYDPISGLLTWRKPAPDSAHASRAGRRAGFADGDGYRCLRIDSTLYFEHHIAWFFVHREWAAFLDHINGKRDDNRITNLRPADARLNNRNRRTPNSTSSTQLLGAFKAPKGKFRSQISTDAGVVYLGQFDTALDAHEAYLTAKAEYHRGAVIGSGSA